MSVAKRKDARHAVAESLKAFRTSSQTVLPFQPAQLVGSPVTTVLSEGSARPPLTGLGNGSVFDIAINDFVLRSGGNWTEEQAEDLLDDLDEQLAEWLVKFKGNTPSWNSLDLVERSSITPYSEEGGKVYLKETHIVRVTVHG